MFFDFDRKLFKILEALLSFNRASKHYKNSFWTTFELKKLKVASINSTK